MTREFKDIAGFIRHLERLPVDIEMAAKHGLTDAARLIRDEAKEEIGQYQPAAGPFGEWKTLSGATLYGFDHPFAGRIPGKIELNYATEAEHRPLERRGDLRESIKFTVQGDEAAIGSDDEVAVYQEMGTPDANYPIPPRSFLGGAAFRKTHEAIRLIATPIVRALSGMPRSQWRGELKTNQ